MPLRGVKSALRSLTVMGPTATLIVWLANALGGQELLTEEAVLGFGAALSELIDRAAPIVMVALAIWGRLQARTLVRLRPWR